MLFFVYLVACKRRILYWDELDVPVVKNLDSRNLELPNSNLGVSCHRLFMSFLSF